MHLSKVPSAKQSFPADVHFVLSQVSPVVALETSQHSYSYFEDAQDPAWRAVTTSPPLLQVIGSEVKSVLAQQSPPVLVHDVPAVTHPDDGTAAFEVSTRKAAAQSMGRREPAWTGRDIAECGFTVFTRVDQIRSLASLGS